MTTSEKKKTLVYSWLPADREGYCSSCKLEFQAGDHRAYHRFQKRIVCNKCALMAEPELTNQPQPPMRPTKVSRPSSNEESSLSVKDRQWIEHVVKETIADECGKLKVAILQYLRGSR